MDNRRKQAACALMTALTVLVTAAFAPAEQRKAAWWGTAFSIACRESVKEENSETVEFRLYLLDCLR
ncbi:hypothetical protein [Agathobaculum sp.]|uniref:hypothetical protein n=1 Tax=Agathobaculum sp. TaxID=2048138 RepID=UPI003AB369BB